MTIRESKNLQYQRRYTALFSFPLLILWLLQLVAGNSSNSGVDYSIPNNNNRNDSKDEDCEVLHNAKLVYEQHGAPRAMSDVLRVVVEKVNREMAGVTNVQITWDGFRMDQTSGIVGVHHVQTLVERSSAVDGRPRCFIVPMEILDTNECTLPPSHEWYHQCSPSAICVNTIGSYDCLCPLLDPQHQATLMNLLTNTSTQAQGWNEVQYGPKRSLWEKNLPSSSSSSSSSKTNKCHGEGSTKFCCESNAHSVEGKLCRSTFLCPLDPCGDSTTTSSFSSSTPSSSPCDTLATCKRSTHPWDSPNYSCTCPEGTIGNGHKCPSSSSSLSSSASKYYLCGCQPIQIYPCADIVCPNKHEECVISSKNQPICKCKKGFSKHPTTGKCISSQPPTLRLKCCNSEDLKKKRECTDATTVYTQGDYYQECGVDIITSNNQTDGDEEEYRSLRIDYSNLYKDGSQCFTQVGTFYVTYQLTIPSFITTTNMSVTKEQEDSSNTSTISIVRTVIVQDIDECALKNKLDSASGQQRGGSGCPMVFVPHCDFASGATCVNTVGSYTCKCPSFTAGDGFRKITDYDLRVEGEPSDHGYLPPVGYQGGTGCVDTTKPVIQILGPNPKVFRLAAIEPILPLRKENEGEESPSSIRTYHKELAEAQRLVRSTYGLQLQNIIDASNGAELCRNNYYYSTTANSVTQAALSKCVNAFDKTYNDTIDLSTKVVVGKLIPIEREDETIPTTTSSGKSRHFRWRVPYNVMDAAGNEAETAYRDVIVEEVSWMSLVEEEEEEIHENERRLIQQAANVEINKLKHQVQILSEKLSQSKQQGCPPCSSDVTTACNCEDYCTIQEVPTNENLAALQPSIQSVISQIWEQLAVVIQPTRENMSSFVTLFLCMAILVAIAALRSLWVVISGKLSNQRNRWNPMLEQQELALLENSVTYYKSPPSRPITEWTSNGGAFSSLQQRQDGTGISPPPRTSRLFSSPADGKIADSYSSISHPEDIYASMSPITPSIRSRSGSRTN
jgi:hypothetical protein